MFLLRYFFSLQQVSLKVGKMGSAYIITLSRSGIVQMALFLRPAFETSRWNMKVKISVQKKMKLKL